MKHDDKRKLSLWEERLTRSTNAYQTELDKIDAREAQYTGERSIRPLTENDKPKKGGTRQTSHVWNITAENIEAEIDSSLPMPKVTPKRKKDERLARVIENFLRNEIDRLPFEKLNDEAERTAKKQGGAGIMIEWDETARTHCTVGDNCISVLHPSRLIPADGAEDIETSEYFFLRLPMSKAQVQRRYGVDVTADGEEHPELRSGASSEDMVTVKIAFYRNEDGGVGKFAWVNDKVLEDMKDAQARRLRRCKKCGQTETESAYAIEAPTYDGSYPEGETPRRARRGECSFCGSRKWEESEEASRTVALSDLARYGVRQDVIDVLTAQFGMPLPPVPQELPAVQMPDVGEVPGMGAPVGEVQMQGGMPPELSTPFGGLAAGVAGDFSARTEEVPARQEITVEIPYYKPDLFPLVILRNVTAHKKFLGESDCDKLADQQNTLNRINQKILDRLIKAGTKITAPPDSRVYMDAEDNTIIRVENIKDLQMIKPLQFDGNLQYEFLLRSAAQEEAQRQLGITESFLGRKDATAQSGRAKEFAAAQTAGRMESKRVLKKLAFSQVFERVFKNALAYADEKRPVYFKNESGAVDYEEFNPWEFLEVDAAGELYWNDQFLFSCDDASGLAANREAMWQECTSMFQSGAYGNPAEVDALLTYWTQMEALHYPTAASTKKLIEDRKKEQQQQQALMMQMQQQQQMQQMQQGAMPAQAAQQGAMPAPSGSTPAQMPPAG